MNFVTAAKRGNLTNHKMTVSKTSITNTETGQGIFQAATPLRTEDHGPRAQLSQFITICSKLVPAVRDCQEARMEGEHAEYSLERD